MQEASSASGPEYFQLGPEHCARLAELESACFSTAWSAEQYSGMMEAGSCKVFGIRMQERLLAYLAVGLAPGVPEMEILNIAVAESERRKGLGGRLLALMIKAAAQCGIDRILLEVRESNDAARRLYERAGFILQGRRRNYYADPHEDALVYSLDCSMYSRNTEQEPESV